MRDWVIFSKYIFEEYWDFRCCIIVVIIEINVSDIKLSYNSHQLYRSSSQRRYRRGTRGSGRCVLVTRGGQGVRVGASLFTWGGQGVRVGASLFTRGRQEVRVGASLVTRGGQGFWSGPSWLPEGDRGFGSVPPWMLKYIYIPIYYLLIRATLGTSPFYLGYIFKIFNLIYPRNARQK